MLDPTHTTVEFEARHLMVAKVKGRFGEFDGVVRIAEDPTRSSTIVTVKTASIDTGTLQRDDHLRSPDFLEVDKYPELTFTSTGVEHVGGDEWKVTGDLTIHGVTRPVALKTRVQRADGRPVGRSARVLARQRRRSIARTGASRGIRRSRPVAGSSARTSRSASRSSRCSRRTDSAPRHVRGGRSESAVPSGPWYEAGSEHGGQLGPAPHLDDRHRLARHEAAAGVAEVAGDSVEAASLQQCFAHFLGISRLRSQDGFGDQVDSVEAETGEGVLGAAAVGRAVPDGEPAHGHRAVTPDRRRREW